MKTATLFAEWQPKKSFKLGPKDIDKKLTYLGSQVWKNPRVEIIEKPEPKITSPTEVIIEVKACGICGSDVHMAQADKQGYIWYPGLTAFPVTLGHEFSGIVVEAGKKAINKRTGKKFEFGEIVTAEEMFWCGSCRPCCDGYPNHCERLHELGFTIEGAMAKYLKVDAKYIWSLDPLLRVYRKYEQLYLAGSLVEPTSVAYNAVIERGGGIRPGDNVVIFGGGPIGLAAVAILKNAGASKVILSEPYPARAELGEIMGADYVINPFKDKVVEAILEITKGMGAKLYLEATGRFDKVWPDIEKSIWEGRQLNSTVVMVARADIRVPVTAEVFQVRRASIVGSQGHSGHGTFPRVIELMAKGMDMTKIITKQIKIEEVPKNLKLLQKDLNECKITVIPD